MHRYYSLFFSVLLFMSACTGTDVPKGIIGHKEMAALLTDVHIIDGTLYNVVQIPDSLYKYGTARYTTLFKRYHTDSTQFKKSMQYYCANPDQLQAIYVKVSASIKALNDSLSKANEKQINIDNKRKADSMRNLPHNGVVAPVQPNTRKEVPFKMPRRRNAVPI
ncbi:MAG TPA: DUF4296 domain-containing protein, partial [Mucilaginibacter sp.]|nr:DUF4296 domain-containing protein [Mucilaginibacter sp.]